MNARPSIDLGPLRGEWSLHYPSLYRAVARHSSAAGRSLISFALRARVLFLQTAALHVTLGALLLHVGCINRPQSASRAVRGLIRLEHYYPAPIPKPIFLNSGTFHYAVEVVDSHNVDFYIQPPRGPRSRIPSGDTPSDVYGPPKAWLLAPGAELVADASHGEYHVVLQSL